MEATIMEKQSPWADADEAADMFGVKLRTIREWTRLGKLGTIVFYAGRRVRYDRNKILERIRLGHAF